MNKKTMTTEPIFYIGANKGGVGKSLFTLLLIHYLFQQYQSKKIIIVESDLSGFDVGVCFNKGDKKFERISVNNADLRTKEGWRKLVDDIVMPNPDSVIVINSAAAAIEGIQQYRSFFEMMTDDEEVNRRVITFWLINREQYGLSALSTYLSEVKSVVHVVKNLHFGTADEFNEFNNADGLKKRVADTGGHILEFAALEEDVATDLRLSELPIEEARNGLKLTARYCLDMWCKRFGKEMDKIIGGCFDATTSDNR